MRGGLESMSIINRFKLVLAAALFGLITLSLPVQVQAAVSNPAPAAKVSFTFDDGYTSAATQAAPTLAKYGLSGTEYVATGCVGMTTVPNSCQADNDKTYLTWNQISQLKNTYGWEIGSHTVSHPYLATSDPDDQPIPIRFPQVIQELAQSKAALAANGIDATAFASPYGDYNAPVLAEIAKYYTSQRGFADVGYNTWPNSDYYLKVQQVQRPVSVATVKSYIDNAIANKQWLVLVFHDIKTNASSNPLDYEYRTRDLDQIAAYVKTKRTAGLIQPVNVSQGLVAGDVNLLSNPSFNSGISGGWSTDSPSLITANGLNNGSYPDPTNSIKFTAGSKNAHLFSPKVAIDPNASYVLKNFLSVQSLIAGEVNFYIDEYDGNGNWISGQYKVAERTVFVEELNFTYKASSSAVKQAALQIGVTANSGITAYLDNAQWFPVTDVPPPPVQTNLVPNGTFDSGISTGWRTDNPSTITTDGGSNGSPANPINSVKLVATTANSHLFSPLVSVDSTKSYSLASYLNIVARSGGEVGFYIDEYDAAGNWISGQWKTGVTLLGSRDVGFTYTPSSASVKGASLQVIVTGGSGITAYFDHVRWYQN